MIHFTAHFAVLTVMKLYQDVKVLICFYLFSFFGLSVFSGLLFYPRKISVSVATTECPLPMEVFEGRFGVYLNGKVSPPVEGVLIVVSYKSISPEVVSVSDISVGSLSTQQA